MTREAVSTNEAPQAIGPYEQAIKAGGFLFTSGQIALDPQSGEMVGSDIKSQTVRVMENLKAVLAAGGSSLDKVIKCTIYLQDLGDFQVVNEIYGSYFFQAKPARSTVQVTALPKGALVEIDIVALV